MPTQHPKPKLGKTVRAAKHSGVFAPEVFNHARQKGWNFQQVIRHAASTLPRPQAKKLKSAAREWRREYRSK